MNSLKDKVALISGAGSGIGKATAIELAKRGAITVLLGRTEAKLRETEEEIRGFGGKAYVKVADVRDHQKIRECVEAITNEIGEIYILFCNAGITTPPTNIEALNFNDFKDILDVHMYGTVHLIHCAVASMKRNPWGGRIILCSSLGATIGLVANQAYSMAKASMMGLMKSLAKELGQYQITVNTVVPGIISTDMTSPMKSQEEIERTIIADTPMGRFGLPEDVAHAVAFFAEPTSSFITGAQLVIDGGYSLETSADKLMRAFIK